MKCVQSRVVSWSLNSESSLTSCDRSHVSAKSSSDNLCVPTAGCAVSSRAWSFYAPTNTTSGDRSENTDETVDRQVSESRETQQASAHAAEQAVVDGEQLSIIPGDDAIGTTNRQILVVGETTAGLAATHLLRHAGYDPLLVSDPSSQVTREVTYLWPPAIELLSALGASDRMLDVGSPLDGVAVQARDGHREYTALPGDNSGLETPAALVRTSTLRQALEDALPVDQRRQERTVSDVTRCEGGVAVEFDDGIQEWFDVVLVADSAATPARCAGRTTRESPPLTQYETVVDAPSRAERTLEEVWFPNALLQRFPCVDDSESLVRLTTPESGLPDCLAGHRETLSATGIPAGLEDELRETDPTTVRQARLPTTDAQGVRWGRDRVAFCGPAAWPAAPASGFRGSFGIEDALAFVAALTRSTRADGDTVDRYATRRLRRLSDIRRRVSVPRRDQEYPPDSSIDPSLERLSVLRSVALGPFLDSRLTALQRAGFE